jgi:hypothetical protein
MIDIRYSKLIDKLIEKTNNKQAIWKKTPSSEFRLDFKSGVITTDIWTEEYSDVVNMTIYNDDGEKIDQLTFCDARDRNDYDILIRLYQTVKRNYLKVDETIGGMLRELSSEEPIGNNDIKENKNVSEPDGFDDIPF